MKIKVCGMREAANIEALEALKPDFMGFIFYSKSPRFVENALPEISAKIKKVGVFVKTAEEEILEIAQNFKLDALQLHSNESPEMCESLKQKGFIVLKAFSVDENFDFSFCEPYASSVDYYLFDTKTPEYGGSGATFDWNILNNYKGNVPFFIAGGISNQNIDELLNFNHKAWVGIDLNSKFEISPALKDINALKELFQKVKNN